MDDILERLQSHTERVPSWEAAAAIEQRDQEIKRLHERTWDLHASRETWKCAAYKWMRDIQQLLRDCRTVVGDLQGTQQYEVASRLRAICDACDRPMDLHKEKERTSWKQWPADEEE
jgi:hypothetical protein